MRIVPMVLLVAGTSVPADTEIHRCLLDDDTFAFQETPCPEPAPAGNDGHAAGDDRGNRDETAPADEGVPVSVVSRPDEPAGQRALSDLPEPGSVSRDRSECEKTTRDAIDAIDHELRDKDANEPRQEYLAELLALTEQLRSCKQL